MATNIVYHDPGGIKLTLDLGGSVSAGDVVILQEMPVLALEDTNTDDEATCMIPSIVAVNLVVKGADGSGNSAVAIGDKVYKDSADYNVDDSNGVLIGYALGTVASGNTTTTIPVALVNS